MTRGPKPRPAIVRFLAQTSKTEGCWNWIGAKQDAGYGRFRGNDTRVVLVHRWSYEHHVGPIADGMTIDHLCRNTSCVNPEHMEVVTREVNAYRGNPNVGKTHCLRGHEFTPENIYVAPSRPHIRDCRACRVERSRARSRKAVA